MSEIPVGSVLEYDHGTYRVVDRRHPSEILPGDDSTDYFMEAIDSETMQAGARMAPRDGHGRPRDPRH